MVQSKNIRAHQGHLLGLAPDEAYEYLKMSQAVVSSEIALAGKEEKEEKEEKPERRGS